MGVWINNGNIRAALQNQAAAAPAATKSIWQEIADFWAAHETQIFNIGLTIIGGAVSIIAKNPGIIGLRMAQTPSLPAESQALIDQLTAKASQLPLEDRKQLDAIVNSTAQL